ncbi:hypothetical protein [Streptococcus oralis]
MLKLRHLQILMRLLIGLLIQMLKLIDLSLLMLKLRHLQILTLMRFG